MTYLFKLARRTAHKIYVGSSAPSSRVSRCCSSAARHSLMIVALGITATACDSDSQTGPEPELPQSSSDVVSAEALGAATTQVTILPGQSIQAKVNAYPAGTHFLLKAGTYAKQTVSPKSGDAFVGETGALLTGQGVTEYAFRGAKGVRGVRIQGLIIEKYNPPVQQAPIRAGGTIGWIIQGNEIRYNATGGLRIGDKMQVLQNYIHHNHQIGIVGSGDSILVDGNEIAYNNWLKEYVFGFELGGAKFVNTNYLIVRNNHVHDNYGNGLWTDMNNIHTLYEKNTVEDNSGAGIFHEVSFAATIRNNITRRNGFAKGWVTGAGILVAASSDVEIYGNQVLDNKQGIVGTQQHRTINGVSFDKNLKNLFAHDNSVRMPSGGVTGIAQDIGDAGVYTTRNNRFQSNHYDLGSDTTPFQWMSKNITKSQWQGYGEDTQGTFN
jgi:Right handed beta helix region